MTRCDAHSLQLVIGLLHKAGTLLFFSPSNIADCDSSFLPSYCNIGNYCLLRTD